MLLEVTKLIVQVKEVFDSLGIPYYVGGSVASGQHGLPRSTRDVDFIADIRGKHVTALVSAFEPDFYADSLAISRAVNARSSFNLIHFETAYKVDVFVSPGDEWSQEKMLRRALIRLGAEAAAPSVYVSSAEDVILQKLRWFQKSGGALGMQLQDVNGVLQVKAANLDYAYLQHWAAELGLTDLLAEALQDAQLPPATDAG